MNYKKSTKKKRMYNRKKLIITVAVCCCLALVCVAGVLAVQHVTGKEGDKVLFYVNKEPVYQEEFLLYADRVKMYQRQNLAMQQGKEEADFSWKDKTDGKSGYEWLAQAAVEAATADKAMLIEAKRLKVTDMIEYPSIMKTMKTENGNREKTKKKDGVVYGVTEYTKEQYYDYYKENINIQTKSKLINNETLKVSEEEALAMYNENRDYFNQEAYETVAVSARNMVLDEKYEAYMEQLTKKAKTDVPDKKELATAIEKKLEQAFGSSK